MRDIRAAEPFVSKMTGHRQEVCGLKWSFDDQQVRLLFWFRVFRFRFGLHVNDGVGDLKGYGSSTDSTV